VIEPEDEDELDAKVAAHALNLYGRCGWSDPTLRRLATSALGQRNTGRIGGGMKCPTCRERGKVGRIASRRYFCYGCRGLFDIRIDVQRGLVLDPA